MAQAHDGIIDAEKVYSTQALAKILGFKQARTVEEKLRERGVWVDLWGSGVTLVSGKDIQLAIERSARCTETD
jgi:hypothetical protein